MLDAVPLTPNGKVDRAALPDGLRRGADRPAARTRTEARLCGARRRGAGASTRSASHDDFFALGGHSLLLVRLATALRRELGVDLPVAELFTAPTVAALARLVSRADGGRRTRRWRVAR